MTAKKLLGLPVECELVHAAAAVRSLTATATMAIAEEFKGWILRVVGILLQRVVPLG